MTAPGGTPYRPADLPPLGGVINPRPDDLNTCERVARRTVHGPHDRGAMGGWCPGMKYDRREAALASFLASDEQVSRLRGHSGEHLRQSAFDVLNGRPDGMWGRSGSDPIENAVHHWIKEPMRQGFIDRLRHYVDSARLIEPVNSARSSTP